MGPRARRARSGACAVPVRRVRCRVRAPVDRRPGGEELVPRHGGALAEGRRAGHGALGRVARRAGPRPAAHRQGRRVRRDGRPGEPADLPRRRAAVRPGHPPVAARAGSACRALSRCGAQGARATRGAAGRGARGHALRAARAPARRGGRRAARRLRVLPRRRGQGGTPAAHLADGRGHHHFERAVRAPGPRRSGVERGRGPRRAALYRRRAAGAGRDPHGGAEAGGGRVRARRRARLRRGGRRTVDLLHAGRARRHPGAVGGGKRAHAGVGERALSRGLGRPARRPAAAARRLRRAHGAAARAERAAGAARQPTPRLGGGWSNQ